MTALRPEDTPRSETEILHRYLNNPRIPREIREDYEARLSDTKSNQWLARGCMSLLLAGGLTIHFILAREVRKIEQDLLEAPAEIHDLGERYWKNPGQGMSVAQAAIANATRSVLAQENSWRRAAVIRIPPTGNKVYALHAYEETVDVNPASLAVVYRRNLESELKAETAHHDKVTDFALMFNGLALIWLLKAGQARREAVDVAFRHYGIK